MQIHELTSKRRQTNEGVVSALAGGVAKQVGQQLLQKQGISTDRFAGQRVAAGQRQGGAAMAANLPALQLMAKKGQDAWVQTQQELAQKANPPVASAAFLPTDQLKPHLTALVNQLAGFDYNKEPGAEKTTPEMALSIKTARDTINQGVDKILSLTKEKPEQAVQPLKAAWEELVMKGVGPMQTYHQSASSATTGAAAPQQADPAVQALVKSIGQTGLTAIAQQVQGKTMGKTNIPAIDGLLAQVGATLK